jgi:endonuclease YncB( thermonuclease family)
MCNGLVVILLMFGICPTVVAQSHRAAAVIDGDRLVLDDGRRIRLAGVDAPERHVSAKLTQDAVASGHDDSQETRLGEIAAAYLAALVRGKPLTVELIGDPVVVAEGAEPAYQPAVVYVADARGGIQYELNARLLADGYARISFDDPVDGLTEYIELYREARARGLGLWAPVPVVKPPSELLAPETLSDDESDPGESACTTNSACRWVTSDTTGAGPGVWQSTPGMQCPCTLPKD